jgi:hypothetical protein
VFHPNEQVRKVGRLLREAKFDPHASKKMIGFALNSKYESQAVDSLSILFAACQSDRREILRYLSRKLSAFIAVCERRQLGIVLAEIQRRCNEGLRNKDARRLARASSGRGVTTQRYKEAA